MFNLSQLSEQLQILLNANVYGIKFDIKADRNEYLNEMRPSADTFTVPCVLTALSGRYEPLPDIKVYYMPVVLECWGYAALATEIPAVPFTMEQQRLALDGVINELNGSTEIYGDNAVIVSSATVTVGDATNEGGGGYTRIPILVQLQLTVVEKAVLSNDVVVEIDGTQVFANEFTVNMEKQTESYTYMGQANVVSLSAAKMRTFSGMFFLTDTAFYQTLEQDLLSNSSVDNSHSLTFKGNTYLVETQTMSELLRMGAVVILQVTFIEVG